MLKQIKIILLISFMCLLTLPAYAQDAGGKQIQLGEYISYLQKEWAIIKYQVPDKKTQLQKIEKLEKFSEEVSAAFPNNAEPRIWEAIILATDAGITNSLSSLFKLKRAKKLLSMSLQIDPNAMDNAAYTTLGSLYYQVPGWPVSFGDKKKARKLLELAVKNSPTDIDSNFFYGDFLSQEGEYENALFFLERALRADARPNRPLADTGRKQEIKEVIAKVREKINKESKGRSNRNRNR